MTSQDSTIPVFSRYVPWDKDLCVLVGGISSSPICSLLFYHQIVIEPPTVCKAPCAVLGKEKQFLRSRGSCLVREIDASTTNYTSGQEGHGVGVAGGLQWAPRCQLRLGRGRLHCDAELSRGLTPLHLAASHSSLKNRII